MIIFLSYIRRAGPPAGPAMPALASILLALFALLQVSFAQSAKRPPVTNSILGVGIATSLEDAHAKLDPLGTSAGRATREGGRKEAWTLKETDYTSIALKTDSKRRVVWVTGFLRPGKEIPFSKLGELSLAPGATDSQAIWNIETPQGGYRLVAKGANGKASVVYLLSLEFPEIQ